MYRACAAVLSAQPAQDALDGTEMLLRIRASLQARLDGVNLGGDSEVMRLVDELIKKEQQ